MNENEAGSAEYREIEAQLGRLVTQWSKIEFLASKLLAELLGVDPAAVHLLINDQPSVKIFMKGSWLAEHLTELSDGPEIAAWYRDVDALRPRRNDMIHSGWALERTSGEWKPSRVRLVTKKGKFSLEKALTTADDVKALVEEVSAVLRRVPRQTD
ncbi:hypothetical protein [Oerskovia gallyi]|uniref:Uncharacterized protein n=1 Tax=Oerskovia gallyi TaxID=2762226 RepID=A0ABR8V429_9CELL|nr:hypothetical protein [Oerskovia gallyi]MBD7999544.1 hypothetical protein [Oerskovia gallyi]